MPLRDADPDRPPVISQIRPGLDTPAPTTPSLSLSHGLQIYFVSACQLTGWLGGRRACRLAAAVVRRACRSCRGPAGTDWLQAARQLTGAGPHARRLTFRLGFAGAGLDAASAGAAGSGVGRLRQGRQQEQQARQQQQAAAAARRLHRCSLGRTGRAEGGGAITGTSPPDSTAGTVRCQRSPGWQASEGRDGGTTPGHHHLITQQARSGVRGDRARRGGTAEPSPRHHHLTTQQARSGVRGHRARRGGTVEPHRDITT